MGGELATQQPQDIEEGLDVGMALLLETMGKPWGNRLVFLDSFLHMFPEQHPQKPIQ